MIQALELVLLGVAGFTIMEMIERIRRIRNKVVVVRDRART